VSSAIVTEDKPSSEVETFDEAAFRSLVNREYGFVFRVLRGFGLSRADAEDCAQQVFLVASDKQDRIDPDRVRSFLYGTALRVAQSTRRKFRRRREEGDVPSDVPGPPDAGPERDAERSEARAVLHAILLELPEKLRRALVLAELGELTIPEIAEVESIPIGTAASRLRLARERFRLILSRRKKP
jgi:RNA polymerase sigma-70 factor (ECF subfamily)